MKRNNSPQIILNHHPDNQDCIVFTGRIDNEISVPTGNITITVYTGYGTTSFKLILVEVTSEAPKWVCEILKVDVNFGHSNQLRELNINTNEQDQIFAIAAQEGAPVIIELYDNETKTVQYLHDLSLDDLPDIYRDVYNRLVMMGDMDGDPLADHLVTEEDFLPVLWMAWQKGEYGSLPVARAIDGRPEDNTVDGGLILESTEYKELENGDIKGTVRFSGDIHIEMDDRIEGRKANIDPAPAERKAWEDEQERRIDGRPE